MYLFPDDEDDDDYEDDEDFDEDNLNDVSYDVTDDTYHSMYDAGKHDQLNSIPCWNYYSTNIVLNCFLS